MRKLDLLLAVFFVLLSTASHAGSGAIAFSRDNGIIGTSYGSGSEMDAERWALQDCRDRGGADCQTAFVETNLCVAFAVGKDNRYGAGTTPTTVAPGNLRRYPDVEQRMEQLAIEYCSKVTSGCEVRLWICN